MQRNSHCQIKIDKEFKEGSNPTERSVSVSGSNMVQICHAIELINTKVDEWRRNYTNGNNSNLNSSVSTGTNSYKSSDTVPKPYWEEMPKNINTTPQGIPPQGYPPFHTQYNTQHNTQYPQGQGLGQGQGMGLGQGVGLGQGQGMGPGMGMGFGVQMGPGQGQGQGIGQGQGYIQGMGMGRY